MAGGAYSALSGMRARLGELDRIAADLANVSTAGYKSERVGVSSAERNEFGAMLDSAVDAVVGRTKVDFSPGVMKTTGNDLDVAIEGKGFFVLDTPAGMRYTRSGNFTRRADGLLVTQDGQTVLGEGGEIRLGRGPVSIEGNGTIRSGGQVVGQLQVVDFLEGDLIRESGARFRSVTGAESQPFAGSLVPGAIEQANVSAVDRMTALTEVTRGFEMMQRGVSVLMNDLDSKAIMELGKR
jgi:flagellar basal-body rod protein FlgF